MFIWVITLKTCNCGDQFEPLSRLRIGAAEIVFSELSNKSIAAEQQRQRFNDSTFTGIVRADEHRVLLETYDASANPSEIFQD